MTTTAVGVPGSLAVGLRHHHQAHRMLRYRQPRRMRHYHHLLPYRQSRRMRHYHHPGSNWMVHPPCRPEPRKMGQFQPRRMGHYHHPRRQGRYCGGVRKLVGAL